MESRARLLLLLASGLLLASIASGQRFVVSLVADTSTPIPGGDPGETFSSFDPEPSVRRSIGTVSNAVASSFAAPVRPELCFLPQARS